MLWKKVKVQTKHDQTVRDLEVHEAHLLKQMGQKYNY